MADGEDGNLQDVWTLIAAQQASAAASATAASGGNSSNLETKGPDGEGTPGAATGATAVAPVAGLETFVLFVGAKQSGKSTLIMQFLNPNKDDEPKPTVALEYTFGRRSNTTSTSKDIAHIWELGGGAQLSELLSVPITPQRLPNAVGLIVIDLSKPGNAMRTLTTWLKLLDERVAECMSKIRRQSPEKAAVLEAAALQRMQLARDSPDYTQVQPSPLPLVIVCTKYDVFQDIDSSKRKVLMIALRYAAHCIGATIICTSSNDKTQMNTFRAVVNHYVFGTEPKKLSVLDPSRAVAVSAGCDSLSAIGQPPGSKRVGPDGTLMSRLEIWKAAVETYFPPEADDSTTDDAAAAQEAAQFPEAAIDAMRAQKDDELDRYVKEAERKLREMLPAAGGPAAGAAGAKKSSSSSKSSGAASAASSGGSTPIPAGASVKTKSSSSRTKK